MARARRSDDDDDDRPRRKSRPRDDDDDDDYDDRPRRSRARRDEPEDGSGYLLWVLLGGGALLVIVVVGVVLALSLKSGSKTTEPSAGPGSGSSTPEGGSTQSDPALFSGEWYPYPNMPPKTTVILRIVGVVDQGTADAINERLDPLIPTGNRRTQSSGRLPRMSWAISPITSAEEFAKKITFGKVVRVERNVIYIVVDQMEGPPTEPIARALHYINSKNDSRRREALTLLLNNDVPDNRRVDVFKALEPLVDGKDLRDEVAEIYCKLATSYNVPTLIKIVTREKNGNRSCTFAMQALARLKDVRGIEPIAARLENFFARGEAKAALIAYGPTAENEIIILLGNNNKDVRIAACEILSKIGTDTCLPALQQAATQDPDFFVKTAAKNAIADIQRRQG
jgi:hypothetical protein